MIRMIRRTLRGWKREFLQYWTKLSAFYRIVLGIILAMVFVAGGRSRFLDPRMRELDDVFETLQRRNVPEHVPTPETDPELEGDRIRLENLRESVEIRREELRAVEAVSPFRLDTRPADASTRLLALLNRNGLRVISNHAVTPPATLTLPAALTAFEIRGSYEGILTFLHEFANEPLLWELRDFLLQAPAESGSGSLHLSFTLHFTPYPGR
jgi:hypothetical protein